MAEDYIFNTKIKVDSKDVTSQLTQLQNRIVNTSSKIEELKKKLEGLKTKTVESDSMAELNKQADEILEGVDQRWAKMQERIANSKFALPKSAWDEYHAAQDQAYAKLEKIQAKRDELTANGGGAQTVDTSAENAEEIAKTEQAIAKEERTLTALNQKYKETEKKQKDVGKTGENAFAKMGQKAKGIGKNLLKLLGFATVIKAIRAGMQQVVSLVKEGFNNLVLFSPEANSSISGFVSALATLKNSLASAFEPIVNMVAPFLTTLVNKLTEASNAMAQFLNAISGKSTFAKAKKQVIDYSKTVSQASSNLAGFDDLNVLNQDSSGGETTGASAFETAEIDGGITSFADKVKTELEKVKSWIGEVKNSFADWWSNLDFGPLISSFENFKQSVQPLVDTIGEGLLWFFENVLQPIGSFVIEDGLPAFFDTLSTAIDAVNQVLTVLKPTLEDIWNNVFVPLGNFLGEVFLTALELVKQVFEELANKITEKSESIHTVVDLICKWFSLAFEYFKNHFRFLKGLLSGAITLVINVVGQVIDIVAGIITFFKDIFTGDFEAALKDIANVGISILNLIIFAVRDAINMIIRGINSLSIDVPDWVPGIGGEHFGFNLAELTWQGIPKLANGGITTGSTLAQIGEAGREAVLPLDSNTGWMNTLADAIAERMPRQGGTAYLQVDGKTFARLELPYLNNENKRVGISFT